MLVKNIDFVENCVKIEFVLGSVEKNMLFV